jgi:hypothetical protein
MTDETSKKKTLNSSDPITGLILEADSYTHFDQMEKLVENKFDLSVLPVQPIYLALKTLPIEKVAELLPRFSKEQREIFLDIDLWNKDEIDVNHFPFWVLAYHLVQDDNVKKEFVSSEQFLLFLKSKFNIWTFDVEEPEYPDHDNYFLTDDALLLFEFEEHYPFVNEVKELVKHLYYEVGVENAYTFLFKLVSDSYLTLQEDEYRFRVERMRDYGFVDYMSALEIENPFINQDFLNHYIKNKTVVPVELMDASKNQNIHNSALVAFKDQFKSIIEELLKITDQKRLDYLQFNFVRLINGRLESTDALKKGSVAMSRTGAATKNVIQLGFSYLLSTEGQNLYNADKKTNVFEKFDFTELYKMGNSLILFNKKKLKKSLTQFQFENDKNESFLGNYWSEFLDQAFESPVKFQRLGEKKPTIIVDYETYELWSYKLRTLIDLLPFARKFLDSFNELKNEGKIRDEFYLNYTVDSIDFETLILSSFANYFLGTYEEYNISKLGLTIDEFKSFADKIISSEGDFIVTPLIFQKIDNFLKTFGLDQIFDFNQYLQSLIKSNLEGYDFQTMSHEDFKHVGGPIILTILKH